MAAEFGHGVTDRTTRDRLAARLTARRARAPSFALTPDPNSIGIPERGRELCAGRYRFGDRVVEAGQLSLWSVDNGGDLDFEAGRQGFSWLDDLAALGSAAARVRADSWIKAWVEIFGSGAGPGWTPPLAGRRLIRLLHHLNWVGGRGGLNGLDPALSRTLDHHVRFLARRAQSAAPGLPRLEAASGLSIGGLSLEGHGNRAEAGLVALEAGCKSYFQPDGGVPSRNPEELLTAFELLVWTDKALSDRGRLTRPNHQQAMEAAAQTLRALRHADGGLARFHGGGRGTPGGLERALSLADIRPATLTGLAMGYARLARGRSTLIVDASAPPKGLASRRAHAGTSAFEMTSARRPLVVNCGAGQGFGNEWIRAARATASHSTLGLDGFSLARLGTESRIRDHLIDGPRDVLADLENAPGPASLVTGHDGYSQSHGLLHVRRLDLGTDGRALAGEDVLTATNRADQKRLKRALDRAGKSGPRAIAYTIRFHLHPDVNARLDMGGRAVSLELPSGELWMFRHSSTALMRLDPSVYLENTRATPLATSQIVLAGSVTDDTTTVKWSIAQATEQTEHVRDLHP